MLVFNFQKVQDEQLAPEESSVLDSDWNDSFLAPDSADFINIFHVHISIEQAMHLTHIVDKSTYETLAYNILYLHQFFL